MSQSTAQILRVNDPPGTSFRSASVSRIPAGWNGNLALCTRNAASLVQNLPTNVSPGAPCSVPAGRAVTAGSVQVLCPASGAGGPLYNINQAAISLLQLKLPNGNYLVPSPPTGKFTFTSLTDPAKFNDHNGMGNFDYVLTPMNKTPSMGLFQP